MKKILAILFVVLCGSAVFGQGLPDRYFPGNINYIFRDSVGIATPNGPQYQLDVDSFAELGTSKFRMGVLPDWMLGPLTVSGAGMGSGQRNFMGSIAFGSDTFNVMSYKFPNVNTIYTFSTTALNGSSMQWQRDFLNPTLARTGLQVDSVQIRHFGKGTLSSDPHTRWFDGTGLDILNLNNSGQLLGNVRNDAEGEFEWFSTSSLRRMIWADPLIDAVGIHVETGEIDHDFHVNGGAKADTVIVRSETQDSVWTEIYHVDTKTTQTNAVNVLSIPIPTDAAVFVEVSYTARQIGTNNSRMGQSLNGWTNNAGTVERESTQSGVGNSFGDFPANVQVEFEVSGTNGIIAVDGPPLMEVVWALTIELSYNLKRD